MTTVRGVPHTGAIYHRAAERHMETISISPDPSAAEVQLKVEVACSGLHNGTNWR